jgi:hypothetical protein
MNCQMFSTGLDATKFLADLKERLAKFALKLHPDKTRLLAFGRFIAGERRARGEGRPETFDFLGFTHICGVKQSTAGTGRSSFQLVRRTRRRRKWATIRAIKLQLQRMRHDPIDEQGRQLASILKGHYAYFAVPTNIDAAYAVRHHVKVRWYLSLRRRSQKRRLSWRRMNVIAEKFLPLPRVLHPCGPSNAFSSDTDGRSRMPELGTSGSVRGAAGNGSSLPRSQSAPYIPPTAGRIDHRIFRESPAGIYDSISTWRPPAKTCRKILTRCGRR